MAKEAYYFSHDANARQDEKILMLRAEHGWEGYGIYWALIEMMFESSDSVLNHSKIKGIAVSYNIDITLLQSVINTCITEELFNSDSEQFWSESLTRRKTKFLDSKAKKSEAGSKGMAKRWGNRQPTDNDVNNGVITENNKGKERKESKENKSNKDIKEHSENTVELTTHLTELMRINNPNVKIPNDLNKWNDEMERIERIDKYDYMQIRSVIDWCQEDHFWKGNILSVPKLREKMGTLIMQMQRPKGAVNKASAGFNKLQQMAREEQEREASGHY